MKTIVCTSIKSMGNVEVMESFETVQEALNDKNSFIRLKRISKITGESNVLIRKTVIKIVKEQEL